MESTQVGDRAFRAVARLAVAIPALAALAYALLRLTFAAPGVHAIPLVILALGAAGVAALGAGRSAWPMPRLELAFVLVTSAALPSPAGVVTAVVAGACSRGGLAEAGSLATAAAAAEILVRLGRSAEVPEPVLLILLYLVIQSLRTAIRRCLDAGRPTAAGRDARRRPGAAALDAIAVPLAWALTPVVAAGAWGPLAAAAATAVGGTALLRRLLAELRRLRAALADRTTELLALHAIGRDALSTLDPARMFEIAERECRQVFAVDLCSAALIEPCTKELRALYRRPRAVDEAPAPCGLARAAAQREWPLRVDDVRDLDPDSTLARDWPPGMRSGLAAPLLVEGRVLGALCVFGREAAAYDEHGAALLATVAHQLALAIDNGRNYRKTTLDSLTSFHSRDYFFQRLEEEHRRALRYGGDFAVLMLDLDGFKQINDRHGHLLGDRFLRTTAAVVRSELREADLPCRYGGDEFCVLLPQTDLVGARAIAERIRSAVARHKLTHEGAVTCATISIGLAGFAEHAGAPPIELLHRADQSLYRAKGSGRDRVASSAA